MQLKYSEEQQMLADSAQRFTQQYYDFPQRSERLNAGSYFNSGYWQNFADLGWLGLPVSEEHGGFGGALGDLMAIQQELGAGLVQEPYLNSAILSGGLLDWAASPAQFEEWLIPLMAGEKRICLAVTEFDCRYAMSGFSTSVRQTEWGYVLDGDKPLVTDGDGADAYIVAAQSPLGVSLFIVRSDHPGVSKKTIISADDRASCSLHFDSVNLLAENRLGDEGNALELLHRYFDLGAAATCADMVGSMRSLLEITVDYAKQRSQFGQPIGKFQVLQHRMADMFMALERARSMLVLLSLAYSESDNQGGSFSQAVSASKVQINKSARYIGQQAVQIHGGIGITQELNVGHYFKRLIVNEGAFGDTRFHLKRYTQLTDSVK
ncbi:MAG: alkylation response protein AidB-like acyl-CoA dehydrogenase [Pseudoalteromonas tetraodonis]|jgi:alkylation response protein AidB-like acyl-CoA dehydrogenase